MVAQLTVVAGPPGSGKTERLLARYRQALAELPPGSALWLAPTWRAAAEIRGRLVEVPAGACFAPGAYFAPGVMTFERFADTVLDASASVIRPMSRLMTRQLIHGTIEDLDRNGRLKHFGPIAKTAGLVDLVADFIRELKRLEIWPEHFRKACEARGIGQKDLELLEIYEAYQQALRENDLYDAEGRFWSVRDWLSKRFSPDAPRSDGARPRFPATIRVVAVDGFTDLTRTQHEILQILAGRADEIHFSLTLEGEPRRKDLFAKPLKTLKELQVRHPELKYEELPRPEKPAWPALGHLERYLFGNPRAAVEAKDVTGLQILAAARERGAIELVGERIKRLLTDGAARPDEIAVVFRSAQDAGSPVAEVLDEYGIPFAVETGSALDRSPALRALTALLRLDVEDWPAATLRAILRSNYFRPAWEVWQGGSAVAAVERTIRRVQAAGGRERVFESLRALRDRTLPTEDENGDAVDRPLERNRQDVAVTLQTLDHLAAALDRLPQKATLSVWADAWRTLARETGLAAAILWGAAAPAANAGETPAPQLALSDRRAWQRLMDALKESEQLDAWLTRSPPELTRAQALAALLDILASETVGHGDDESGRVRVLSASSARALKIPHLFFAGLSEKSFPAPDREDRLYGEVEYERLIEKGLPLVARSERNREEMLLFYETLTRATRQLVLSYPAIDDSGQPLSPSPYLKDLEQACGKGRIPRTEFGDLSPVPAGAEPLSETEYRVRAMADALDGDLKRLAGLHAAEPAVGRRLAVGLLFADARQDRKAFGATEGVFAGGAAVAAIASRYPAERTFTATELERYATCPYRFFLERIAKVEPLEEIELEIDFLQRGQLAHELLAVFHRQVNAAMGHPASPRELPQDVYDRLWKETFDKIVPRGDGRSVQSALREVDRRVLRDWIATYLDQVKKYDGLWEDLQTPMRPEFFEVSFGRGHGEGPPSTEQPLEIYSDNGTVRVSGRIDRIDTGQIAGTAVFNILDYKTGGSSRFTDESLAAGSSLQLPIYALAAAELLLNDRGGLPWHAGYWVLSEGGFKPRQALRMYRLDESGKIVLEDDWEQRRAVLEQTVASLVGRLRRGEFPVYNRDENCTGNCCYATVCRINHIRSLEKTWTPNLVDQHGK